MRILIVRHGDPDYEKDSLTPKGFREAELLAERLCKLDVKAFYCSPLGRAQDTARPTLQRLGRSAETLDWLQEFRGQVRRGLKVEGCWDRLPSYWCREDNYYSADAWLNTRLMQSKNVEKEYRYVCRNLDTLLAQHGYRHNGRVFDVVDGNHDTIVLFCHFGVEAVLLSHLLSVSPMPLWHNFVALPLSVCSSLAICPTCMRRGSRRRLPRGFANALKMIPAIKKNIKNAPCPGSIPVGCIIFVLDARAVGGWAPPPAQRQAPYPWRSVRFVQHKQRLDSAGPTTGIAWHSRWRCRAAGAR